MMKQVGIPADIANRAEGFSGRIWVLDEVIDWMDSGSERFFLITGEPGSGNPTFMINLVGHRGSPHHFLGKGSLIDAGGRG